MYNVVIYPYEPSNKETILHMNRDLYKIKGIVSPRGWGYCGERIKGEGLDCYIRESITEINEYFDCVCIVDSKISWDIIPSFVEILEICKEKKLKVIWCKKNEDEKLKKLVEYVPKEKVVLLKNSYLGIEKRKVYDINTPIVFLIDMFSGMSSQDISLKIVDEIRKRGYKTKLITDKKNMSLVKDVELIPDIFFERGSSIQNRIVNFNQYIKSIEETLDIILIDIPGNALEVSKDIFGDFGHSLFMISRTIIPDYVVCNTPFVNLIEEKIEILEKFIEKRIETEIDVFTIVPQYLDLVNSESFQEMDYTTLSNEFVNKKIGDSERIYFLQNRIELIQLVDDIISKLENYSRISTI